MPVVGLEAINQIHLTDVLSPCDLSNRIHQASDVVTEVVIISIYSTHVLPLNKFSAQMLI